MTTPDDPNPGVWVNHAVTVDASASRADRVGR